MLNIPYMFLYRPQEERYIAGAQIQTLFNYFLNSLSYDFIEEKFTPESAIDEFDKIKKRYMLGITIKQNSDSKHAVIYEGMEKNGYRFLNPKRKDSIEPDYYVFNKDELIGKLPLEILMGYLIKIKKAVSFDVLDKLVISLENIDKYRNLLIEYCSKKRDVNSLKKTKEILFAPLLLDVLAMMEIIGEAKLAIDLKNIRTKYMDALKENKALMLLDYIAPEYLYDTITKYKSVILNYIPKYKITLSETCKNV